MKKITLLLTLVSTALFYSYGQNIPNGDMETWIPVAGYDSLVSFTSTNSFFFPTVNVTKDTDAHGGSFAAKMVGTTWLGVFPVPGGIGTNAKVNLTTFTLSGGYPYSQRPVAFTGWFKYAPVNNDSCIMLALFTKWNGTKRDTIGIAPYFGKGTAGAYQEFYTNVLYLSAENPDTAFVLTLTSSAFLTAQVGSVLYIDDLNFTFNTGVNEVKNVDQVIAAYPNPARDRFTIELKDNHDAVSVELFDVLGNKVKQSKVTSNSIVFSTSSLVDGLYFYQLKDANDKSLVSGKFSVRK
ncbi:MAG: T9SS type A sorting domain-containing protein [Chitinophagaceae bacterium]|nr:T9SS type A sorting domain-containing protein [Chitinophagaceae bacterium]